MLEPDFGELQFQQLFNNDLIAKLPGLGIHPIIPTLAEEHYLGWDTGFNIPWFKPPDPSQKYCNLFLQYKLSKVIEGPRGGQWHHWGQSYFRFSIAHWKNSGHPGGTYPDFRQYDSLKSLVSNGYLGFYITNYTLDLDELLEWADLGVITESNPALDVSDITVQHIVATFTRNSGYFVLDSEKEEISKVHLGTIKDTFLKARRTSLREDVETIPVLLRKNDIFTRVYELRRKEREVDTIESEWSRLYHTVTQTIGLVWWKFDLDSKMNKH